MNWQLVCPRGVVAAPWRNGGGTTRLARPWPADWEVQA